MFLFLFIHIYIDSHLRVYKIKKTLLIIAKFKFANRHTNSKHMKKKKTMTKREI